MPMYEYECPGCQKVLEIIQKFSDPVLTECPECKGPISKLISRTSFQLKGSGWYASDYKKSSSSSSTTTTPAKAETKASDTTPKPSGGGGCGSGSCGSGHKH